MEGASVSQLERCCGSACDNLGWSVATYTAKLPGKHGSSDSMNRPPCGKLKARVGIGPGS